MMVGTILSNFWVALIAFSVYFLFSFPFIEGKGIILDALIVAITFFLVTFFARAIISYIISNRIEEPHSGEGTEILKSEISPEDYAELVKTMLKEDE
ncbi:hypothetical protein SAMN05518871_101537 [Psychrobacillus sp. OK028]|uniref:hypothetical protein n=1 Tax=Psychrobacillus sp. OK028 TaxID=1884359 RepID=UPI0008861F03|nr:hypothetical protein [Psychrobacillus sp. OK028]SDM56017.1 hypothetical protein SAMN05518871_101537 [Psychrobacillus sp. OK028]